MQRYSNALIVLFLGLSIAACASNPEKAKQKEVERVLNRTITETQVKQVPVVEYVNLPNSLLHPCAVTHNKDRSIGEYVRVAIENTANAQKCKNEHDGIRQLQPDQSKLPQK